MVGQQHLQMLEAVAVERFPSAQMNCKGQELYLLTVESVMDLEAVVRVGESLFVGRCNNSPS